MEGFAKIKTDEETWQDAIWCLDIMWTWTKSGRKTELTLLCQIIVLGCALAFSAQHLCDHVTNKVFVLWAWEVSVASLLSCSTFYDPPDLSRDPPGGPDQPWKILCICSSIPARMSSFSYFFYLSACQPTPSSHISFPALFPCHTLTLLSFQVLTLPPALRWLLFPPFPVIRPSPPTCPPVPTSLIIPACSPAHFHWFSGVSQFFLYLPACWIFDSFVIRPKTRINVGVTFLQITHMCAVIKVWFGLGTQTTWLVMRNSAHIPVPIIWTTSPWYLLLKSWYTCETYKFNISAKTYNAKIYSASWDADASENVNGGFWLVLRGSDLLPHNTTLRSRQVGVVLWKIWRI